MNTHDAFVFAKREIENLIEVLGDNAITAQLWTIVREGKRGNTAEWIRVQKEYAEVGGKLVAAYQEVGKCLQKHGLNKQQRKETLAMIMSYAEQQAQSMLEIACGVEGKVDSHLFGDIESLNGFSRK